MFDENPSSKREFGVGTSPVGPGSGDRAVPPEFRLTLYICGATEKSRRAVGHVRRLCDEHLPGRYTLEIIDLLRRQELAHSIDIVATPTLILEGPRALRRFIGDLSSNERLVFHMTARDVIDP